MSDLDAATLQAWVRDAFARCLALVTDLDDAQWVGPQDPELNPPGWELGHVAWFHERWFLRHACGEAAGRADADDLYDSIAIAHDRRWSLPVPDRAGTLAYVAQAREVIDLSVSAQKDVIDAAAALRRAEPSEAG